MWIEVWQQRYHIINGMMIQLIYEYDDGHGLKEIFIEL